MAAKIKAKRASLTGRPSSFLPEYVTQARNYCLLGATNEDLAGLFEVDVRTIDRWIAEKPDFCRAVKKGRKAADGRVAQSLYHRAIGYSHPAVKILAVAKGENQGSEVEQIPYVERYAPDTTAAIFWLKNRSPDQWRDKQTVEHDVTDRLADAMREAEERVAASI